jgi:hypothetical protein
MLSSSQVEWYCPECEVNVNECRKYCNDCETMLVWTCVPSEKSGLYSNYYRHRQRCNYCTPELEQEREELKREKQNESMQELQMLYDGKQHSPVSLHVNFYL